MWAIPSLLSLAPGPTFSYRTQLGETEAKRKKGSRGYGNKPIKTTFVFLTLRIFKFFIVVRFRSRYNF